MKRPLCLLGALTVGASLGLLGCEHWRGQSLRPNGGDPSPAVEKKSDLDSEVPKGTHSGGIKSGTWSDQAREIESHFGK